MSKIRFTALVLAAAGAGFVTAYAIQPETGKKPAQPAAQPEMDPMMEAWMKAGQPGPIHEHFKPFVGEWTGTVKMFEDPNAPPQEMATRCVAKLEFDGRFLFNHWEGNFMEMPFVGYAAWGYNNVSKKLESVWMDNMSTFIQYGSGNPDASGKIFTFNSQMDDPMTGGKIPTREVVTLIDHNNFKLEGYKTIDGKEVKSMVITMTRSTAAPDGTSSTPHKGR